MRIRSEATTAVVGEKAKSKNHATPATSPSAAAQLGTQGGEGLSFGVFPLLRQPAPLSSGVMLTKAQGENMSDEAR